MYRNFISNVGFEEYEWERVYLSSWHAMVAYNAIFAED